MKPLALTPGNPSPRDGRHPIWTAGPTDPARRCCPSCLGTGATPTIEDTTGSHPEAEPDCSLAWYECDRCHGRGWLPPDRGLRHAPPWRAPREMFLARDTAIDETGRALAGYEEDWATCHAAHRQGRGWRALRIIARARGELHQEDCPACDGAGTRRRARNRHGIIVDSWRPWWHCRSRRGVTIDPEPTACDACTGTGAMDSADADGWLTAGYAPSRWGEQPFDEATEICECPEMDWIGDMRDLLRDCGPAADRGRIARLLPYPRSLREAERDTHTAPLPRPGPTEAEASEERSHP